MTVKITAKNLLALKAIHDFTAEHKYPPTYVDLRERLNSRSQSTVFEHIRRLRKAGYVEHEPKQSRSLVVTDLGLEALKDMG